MSNSNRAAVEKATLEAVVLSRVAFGNELRDLLQHFCITNVTTLAETEITWLPEDLTTVQKQLFCAAIAAARAFLAAAANREATLYDHLTVTPHYCPDMEADASTVSQDFTRRRARVKNSNTRGGAPPKLAGRGRAGAGGVKKSNTRGGARVKNSNTRGGARVKNSNTRGGAPPKPVGRERAGAGGVKKSNRGGAPPKPAGRG
jgi:hypothetical protein